jgi:hypothetical protein
MQTISIIITNFNYARYLEAAIQSALSQTYDRVQVIVVDDGSTDHSSEIIKEYEAEIMPIFKANGGQASAFNVGFHASDGDIIIFLDADDVLRPETAARVAREFERDPSLAKVHYRLEIVDADGHSLGRVVPVSSVPLPQGNLRDRLLVAPGDFAYPPCSGNAFSARVLRQILPMPERAWRISADTYLLNVSPLLGSVSALEQVGGSYRLHDTNAVHSSSFDLERIRQTIQRTHLTNAMFADRARALQLVPAAESIRFTSVTDLAQRLMSMRLAPELHPIADDRALSLAVSGVAASLRRGDLSYSRRALYCGWFAAAGILPQGVTRRLSKRLFRAWQSGEVRRAATGEGYAR